MTPPLLLLHAFPLDARMWDDLVPALERAGFETLAPTLPGRDPANDLGTWAERVVELLPGDFIPIGCSMGGYLTFELWRRAGKRIRAAVFIDTRAGADTPEAREGREQNIRLLEQEGFEPFWEAQRPRLFGPSAAPEVVERARSIATEQPVENLVATLQALADRPDSGDTAARMDVPALVIVGEEDSLTPVSEAEELAALLPVAKLVRVPEAGHLAPLEAPDRIKEELLVFLAGLAPAR